jgi:hypothetical protein
MSAAKSFIEMYSNRNLKFLQTLSGKSKLPNKVIKEEIDLKDQLKTASEIFKRHDNG